MFISCEDFFIIVKNQYTCTYRYMLVHAYTTVSMHMPFYICLCVSKSCGVSVLYSGSA